MPASTQITQLAKDDQDFVLRDKIGLILGGMPDTNDVVPSALIVIMYVALFAPIVFRIRTHTLTFGQVWKPLLFILMRIATFAMRIQLAQTSQWKNAVFITQLIFLRLGPIILTSALVRLFGDAVLPYLPSVDAPNLFVKISLKYFVSALNVLTYFCLGLTIAVAFDVKQAINGNVEARAKLHRSKEISIWLLVAINSSIYLLTIIPIVLLQQGQYVRHLLVSKSREHSKFMAVLSVCTFLLVVSGFKAAQLMSHGLHTTYVVIINKKILFYSICCFGEYVACLLLVTAAWARIVPPPSLLEAYCRIHKQRTQQDGARPADSYAPPMQATTAMSQTQRSLPYATVPRPAIDESGGQSNTVSRAPGGVYATPGKEVIPRVAKIIHQVGSNGHHGADHGSEGVPEDLSNSGCEAKDHEDVTWSTIPISAPNESTVPHRSATVTSPQQDAKVHLDTPTPRRVSSTTLSTISEVGVVDAVTNDSTTTAVRADSMDSLILPPNLLPHYPDPQSTFNQTPSLPRPASPKAPAPAEKDSVPSGCTRLPMSPTELVGQHQPLAVLSDSLQPSSGFAKASRTVLGPSPLSTQSPTGVTVPFSAGTNPTNTADPAVSAGDSSGNASFFTSREGLPTSARSVHSHWSDDSEDDRASASSSRHHHFHHHHPHLHLHRHKKDGRHHRSHNWE